MHFLQEIYLEVPEYINNYVVVSTSTRLINILKTVKYSFW
jgi:hypothetical protein